MSEPFTPAYLSLYHSGELAERVRRAHEHLVRCELCPNYCRVNRLQSPRGARCRSGRRAAVASYGPHHGEEQVLVGRRGSGTLFFSRCNLRCVFCQNWDISQEDRGREVTATELAAMMLELQGLGCHNINLVSPSHVLAPLLAALFLAIRKGLRLPLVYNTGGYDSPEALALLDGVVDIYMPDMKFADSKVAQPLLGVADYAEVNRKAVREMHRQVGDLVLDDQGIAQRGLLLRHLVLPENLAGSDRVLSFIAEQLSRNTYLNLMDQYRPCYRADRYPPLDRSTSRAEYRRAVRWAEAAGLQRLDRC
ncbi:radical SAM protein [Syntrophotalea acetylenivorans]|uniref:Radical SAM protein n=1 Tax=Syntrophotalea acetylenivorans TaxID=1842532 RepID=A0A1L3GQB6_9BACT|nr:radical SAM protein [Syntrophotalea acetylenivorans]APG28146.1 radical SAM protein [Syntrophotalea acetylenivorans]